MPPKHCCGLSCVRQRRFGKLHEPLASCLVVERKGVQDARMLEFRWLLEELRVSFFAQALRTPQPVSIKRLEKAWGQLTS